MFRRILCYLSFIFPKRCKMQDGKDGERVAAGPGAFAKGGAGGIPGVNGGRGEPGGYMVVREFPEPKPYRFSGNYKGDRM